MKKILLSIIILSIIFVLSVTLASARILDPRLPGPRQPYVDDDEDGYDTCDLGEPGDDGLPKDCDDTDENVYPDAPGFTNVKKSSLPATYKGNFEAKVEGPEGWCKCTWDVIIDTAVGKNDIENVVCTAG